MSWVSPPSGQTAQTKRALPSHKPWIPLPYMERGVHHLMTHASGGLALDPGLRKTSITLAAFKLLRAKGVVRTMLVIAPLRVCRKVWRQEGAKWSDFRDLKFSLIHGSKKDAALKAEADVYLINPEGIPWLCKKFMGRSLPFDVVTIDELTKFKNAQSERSKALRPRLARVAWRWGLTGSLAPNGFMDLFGQMLMLDDGAALGRYITHYRDQYFQLDFDGFTYNLMPGAERRIVTKIAPYWLQMSADDYLTLPPLVADPVMIEMDHASRKTYDKMKRDMIAELPEGVVTAANAAACYSKLAQMANGAVYVGDSRQVSHVHDAKLDALEDIVEELAGQPLLVAYEFNHDLDRLRERFGRVDPKTGQKVIPYLGKGTTERQESAWMDAWNRNEIPVFPCHPASAGHGLNLQEGSAGHVAWFGVTWDLELYDQFIRRIRRSGNEAQRIVNHLLLVSGTIDELKLAALTDKDMTQGRLLKALNTEISRDAEARAGREQPVQDDRRLPMVARLGRQADAPQPAHAPAQQQQAQERVAPKGWGAQQANGNGAAHAAQDDTASQRERIVERIAPQQPAEQPQPETARSAFTGNVLGQMETLRSVNYDAPAAGAKTVGVSEELAAAAAAPARTRRSRAPQAEIPARTGGEVIDSALIAARAECLKIVFADPQTTLEEGLEQARLMMEFVAEG